MAYRLRDANGKIAAMGLKSDSAFGCVPLRPSAPVNALYSCVNQGIQKRWGDLYDSTLDGQWDDITGVPTATTRWNRANPQGIILESDYSTTSPRFRFRLATPARRRERQLRQRPSLVGPVSPASGHHLERHEGIERTQPRRQCWRHSFGINDGAAEHQAVTIDTRAAASTPWWPSTPAQLGGLSLVAAMMTSGQPTFKAGPRSSRPQESCIESRWMVLTARPEHHPHAQQTTARQFLPVVSLSGVSRSGLRQQCGRHPGAGEPNHAGNPRRRIDLVLLDGTAERVRSRSTWSAARFNTLLAAYSGNVPDQSHAHCQQR